MAESKLSILERESGDVTILVLGGQILLDDGDLAIRLKIHDLIDRGKIKLVLDLSGVSYIDSAGVGMLAAKHKMLRDRGGDLKLLHLTTRGQRVFAIAKLLLSFETFDDEAMAVKSYRFPSP
jgi:anti-sigma B factor antagonist